jgi:hypothetical protein
MCKKLLPISLLTFLLVSPEIGVSAEDQLIEAHFGGFLRVPMERGVDRSFGYGFLRYVPVCKLPPFWKEESFALGSSTTWMFAQDSPIYSDIEGGLGWVGPGIRFPCGMHKLSGMGGVAPKFSEIADAPIKGTGSWDKPGCGLYAVAQLSNRLLFPPDGILFIPKDERGGLIGYGYINLPLADPKDKTDGKDIPTGGNCWTLVLSTNNFKGPVAFFTPYFWSRYTLDHPEFAGRFLDSKPADPNRTCAKEIHSIPCRIAKDKNGVMYVRMAKFIYTINHDGVSVVHHRDMVFNEKAFYEPLKVWFSGGPAPAGKLDPNNVYIRKVAVKEGHYPSLSLYIPTGKEKEEKVVPLDWLAFATPIAVDEHTFGFKWNPKYVKNYGGYVILPEYYRVENPDDPKKARVVPVLPEEIPTEVYQKLKEVKFPPPESNPKPFTTPDDPESCWKKPGPVAGPFKAYLRDGSVVTYYWYRFADQPALLNAGLTKEERERMQKRVEMIHRYWNENIKSLFDYYLLPPKVSKLVDLDPAQIVTPPKGLEVGYVPIVVRQELAKEKPKKGKH